MTENARDLILTEIGSSSDSLSLETYNSGNSASPIIAIVTFAKKRWKINTPLYYSQNLSDEDIFESNGLHLREVALSSPLPSERLYANMILQVYSEGYLVKYQRLGKIFYFDPITYLSSEKPRLVASSVSPLAQYEIYRQLPWNITNPKHILRFTISGDRGKFILIASVSLAVMLLGLAVPILTGFLTNTVIPSSSLELLLQTLIPCVLILLVTSLMNYVQGLVLLVVESSVDLKLQSAVWQKVYKLPMLFFEKYSTGDLLSRVNAISAIRRALGNTAVLSVLKLLFSLVFFVLMLVYDWQLTIGAIVVTLLSVCIISLSIYRQALKQIPFLERQGDLSNFAYQAIVGIPQIRSTNAEPFVLKRWYYKIDQTLLSQRNIEYWQGILSGYSSINQPLGTVVIYAIIVYRLVLKAEPPTPSDVILVLSTFLPFYQAYTSFNAQLQSVIASFGDVVAQVVIQWDRAKPILYCKEEEGFAPDSIPISVEGKIEFINVSFSYDILKPPLLKNLNFTIPSGSFTAFMGASGCGKSTILKILLGFLTPQEGSVLIDGVPLNQLNIRHYRRQLGVVLQSTNLPPGTIYDIICAGRSYTEDQVWEVLKLCAIAKQIKTFPMGLETIITESPSISGGQRQRIALARALISRPRILLLDEATSALDAASQKIITDSVSSLGITRVSIAHRTSTIQSADQIIYLKDNSVSSIGTYEQLLNSGTLR